LKTHPFEVIPGGLNGVLTGLKKLKDGNVSAMKYVYRIKDTEDVTMLGSAGSQETGRPTSEKAAGILSERKSRGGEEQLVWVELMEIQPHDSATKSRHHRSHRLDLSTTPYICGEV
jgi:hypothetical protein